MAAITFDLVGTELTQVRAENPSPLAPIESGARVRIKKFSYTVPTGGTPASGTQIELAEFGKSVSIIGGAVTGISLSNSATLDLGWTPTASPVDTNVNVFVDGITAATVFSPVLVTTTGATTVFGTTGVGALAAADVVTGYILYVENT